MKLSVAYYNNIIFIYKNITYIKYTNRRIISSLKSENFLFHYLGYNSNMKAQIKNNSANTNTTQDGDKIPSKTSQNATGQVLSSKTINNPPKAKKTLKTRNKGKKKKLPKVSALNKKLDAIFSAYIRLKYSDRNGIAKCYTCGQYQHYTKLQNGHFFSRSRYSTRWTEDNCRVQCYRCNVAFNGNYIVYTLKMLDEVGRTEIERLEELSLKPYKADRELLLKNIELYTAKVKELQNRY